MRILEIRARQFDAVQKGNRNGIDLVHRYAISVLKS